MKTKKENKMKKRLFRAIQAGNPIEVYDILVDHFRVEDKDNSFYPSCIDNRFLFDYGIHVLQFGMI